MPNVNANVPLDNYIQSGDTTIAQLQEELAAAGVAASYGPPERDAQGKPVRLLITLPDAAAATAMEKINANKGVPTTVVPVPPELQVLELTNAVLNVPDLEINANAAAGDEFWYQLTFFALNQGVLGSFAGVAADPYTPPSFQQGVTLPSAAPLRMDIYFDVNGIPTHTPGDVIMAWRAGDTITLTPGGLALTFTKDFTFHTDVAYGPSLGCELQFSADGKIYFGAGAFAGNQGGIKSGSDVLFSNWQGTPPAGFPTDPVIPGARTDFATSVQGGPL